METPFYLDPLMICHSKPKILPYNSATHPTRRVLANVSQPSHLNWYEAFPLSHFQHALITADFGACRNR